MLTTAIHHNINTLDRSGIAYKMYYVNHENCGGARGSYLGPKWSEGFSVTDLDGRTPYPYRGGRSGDAIVDKYVCIPVTRGVKFLRFVHRCITS